MPVLPGFVPLAPMPETSVQAFSGRVSDDVTALWRDGGLGTAVDGYLRVVDPAVWEPIIREVYPGHDEAVPVFVTGLGDVIVYEKEYFNLLRFRKGDVDVAGRKFSLLVRFLGDRTFLERKLDWSAYPQAVERYGELAFDECFGYVPLLALGGPERVENLQKVMAREHVLLISQLAGPLDFDV